MSSQDEPPIVRPVDSGKVLWGRPDEERAKALEGGSLKRIVKSVHAPHPHAMFLPEPEDKGLLSKVPWGLVIGLIFVVASILFFNPQFSHPLKPVLR